MIHCIGNSHACLFSGSNVHPGCFHIWPQRNNFDQLPFFRTYSIGPAIAYYFYEHHHYKILDIINNVHIPKTDSIMFCIGEVDCRWHIPFQAKLQNRTIEEVIVECVQRYFQSLKEINNMGYKVMAWMAHPSTIAGHNENPDSPVYETCQIRNEISCLFNNELNKLCKQHGIYFLDIFKQLLDPVTGLTDMNYYIDYCHLDAIKTMPLIIEKLKRDKIIL